MRPVYRVWLGKLYKLDVTKRWTDAEGDTCCNIIPDQGMYGEQGVGVTVFDTAEQAIEAYMAHRKERLTGLLAAFHASVLDVEKELASLPAKREALEQARKLLEEP